MCRFLIFTLFSQEKKRNIIAKANKFGNKVIMILQQTYAIKEMP